MKKLSILLALVLMLGMLTGCNTEETIDPDQKIPGYEIGMLVGDGWTAPEETEYDLELEKNGMKIYAVGFSPADFVDLPTAEDMYIDCNSDLFETLTDVSTVEEESTYTAGDKQITVSMYSGKEGDTTRQFYCFMVDFGEETGNMAWVAFSAKESDMKKNKDSFKAIVDGMVCTAEPYDYEAESEDELVFDENGEPIYDTTGPEDYVEEPAETTESTEAEPTEGTEGTEGTEATDATVTATTEAAA